jgi:NHL repeat-containing protein
MPGPARAVLATASLTLVWPMCGPAAGQSPISAARVVPVAGTGLDAPHTPVGGPASGAALEPAFQPTAVAGLADGGVAFASKTAVLRVDRGGRLSLIAGARRAGTGGDGGPATAARFGAIGDLALAADGALLVADEDQHSPSVRRIGPDGRISLLAGAGPPAELCGPEGLAVGPTGSVFVADTCGERVLELTRTGEVRAVAGTGLVGDVLRDGPATSVSLRFPRYVVAVPGGVVIGDVLGLRLLGADGVLRTLRPAPGTAPAPGRTPRLVWVGAEAVGDGSVLTSRAPFVDFATGALFAVAADGRATRVAGGPFVGFDGDGEAAATAALRVLDADVGPSGDVVLAEEQRVRRIAVAPAQGLAIALTAPHSGARGAVRAAFHATPPPASRSRSAVGAGRSGAQAPPRPPATGSHRWSPAQRRGCTRSAPTRLLPTARWRPT